MSAIKAVKSKLFPKTLDNVVAYFNKAIADLEEVHANLNKQKDDAIIAATKARAEQQAAEEQILRAVAIKANLQKLIEA